MNNNVSIEKLIKKMKTDEFMLSLRLPMGYVPGYPVVQIKNDNLCLLVPFLKYKVTGVVDKTLVYPIRYAVLVEVPEGRIVGFDNLEFDSAFGEVQFNEPVGFFRHDSIKNLTKSGYNAEKKALFAYYDKYVCSLLEGTEFTDKDKAEMKEKLRLLVEPSLYPIYKVLDSNFYAEYLMD